MSEKIKLCQYRQAHICCMPEGHTGSHYPVDVSEQWIGMLVVIKHRDEHIRRLQQELDKYLPDVDVPPEEL